MVSPASTTPLPSTSPGAPAVFSISRPALPAVGVFVESDGDDTAEPPGSLPVADEVLTTAPESTSPWVTTYGDVAAQSVASPAPRTVASHVTVPALSSTTA